MYLIDTNVISELRKHSRSNAGVVDFFRSATTRGAALYVSLVTIGELRRGVEQIRHRGDSLQAEALERWLTSLLDEYSDLILPLDLDSAQLWGRLRVPNHEHELDKQVAAIALVHGLTVVTRNVAHFHGTGATVLNPFH